jgi:hypothetical protein
MPCRTAIEALQQAAENMVSDRLLAGFRQVEEHMQREASDGRARMVRSGLEGAHGEADLVGIAQRVLRMPDARSPALIVTYSGLDEGCRCEPQELSRGGYGFPSRRCDRARPSRSRRRTECYLG